MAVAMRGELLSGYRPPGKFAVPPRILRGKVGIVALGRKTAAAMAGWSSWNMLDTYVWVTRSDRAMAEVQSLNLGEIG